MNVSDFKVKIFADGADLSTMIEMNKLQHIQGLTTNPTLMRKAGILDYKKFAKEVLIHVNKKSISFEVFSDDFGEMERQALEISSWAPNVYVKIPITNTRGEDSYGLIKQLTKAGVKVNVTAIMTVKQVELLCDSLCSDVPSYVSIFAGRIADTGVDPLPIMRSSLNLIKNNSNAEMIWASPRELLNLVQANDIGCHIITVTNDILNKLKLIGYDLTSYSLDTVKMFYEDAQASNYDL